MAEDAPDKPHYLGHRERLRDKFLEQGPDALADYEIIELVRTGRVVMLRGSEVSHPHEDYEEEHYERAPGVHTW